MPKEFITSDAIRDAALKLVNRMYRQDGFVPDVLYNLLRGGAFMSNVMSEYYKAAVPEHNVTYAGVVAHSYAGINKREKKVVFEGWTFPPESLRKGQKILVIDDVYDSGWTIHDMVSLIMKQGIPREDIKVAVFDYKIHNYKPQEKLPIQPDYWCRKLVYERPEDEVWIHYLCHEIVGLTEDEITEQYKDPEVRQILRELNI